ncbi:MAG TPA: ANTAR domain-containing protein [Pseudonocardiaceae bacterium]
MSPPTKRWPGFAALMSRACYRSCLAVPLSTQSGQTAVLTLVSAQPDQFADTAYDITLLLTLHAGVVFDNATLYHDSSRLVAQLRTALRTRSVISQAQGLLMHRLGYDGDRAFMALKQASQNSNTKLRDLAGLLVDAHQQGELEAAFRKLTLVDTGKTPS